MLDADQVQAFQRDGFVVLRGFVAPHACSGLRAAAEDELSRGAEPAEYEADVSYPGSPGSREAEGGRTIRRLLRAYDRHPAFREWACAPPLASVLRALLGPRPLLVQAHHNCVMTKQPRFSSDTGWHQDIRYWSFTKPGLVTAWLALTEEHQGNGCLRLVPGSHLEPLADDMLDVRKFLRADHPRVQSWLRREVAACLVPGDVLLFDGRTFHAASRNRTETAKLSLVFTYKDSDNNALPGTRSSALPEIPLAT